MGPYAFLFGFTVLFYSVMRRVKQTSCYKGGIYSVSTAMAIALLLGLRHPAMGRDLGYGQGNGYLASFLVLSELPWRQVLQMESFLNYEKGYILFNKLVGSIWKNEQFFLLCCSMASVLPVGITIGKYSRNCRASFLIYFGLTVFHILFSGLRQAIAVAIVFWSFGYIRERKWKQYLAAILVAWLFHSSAMYAVLLYPAYWVKLNRKAQLVAVFLLPVCFVLRVPLWNLLTRLAGKGGAAIHTGSVQLMLLFWAVYIYMLMYTPGSSPFAGLVNIHYLACGILVFSEISNSVQRVCYYYMMFLVLSLPESLYSIRKRKCGWEYMLHYTITVGGFVLFGVRNLLHTGWSGAYPFYYFWENLLL